MSNSRATLAVLAVIASIFTTPQAQSFTEDGVNVLRANYTYFVGEEIRALCTYQRNDGLLNRLEWLINGEVYLMGDPSLHYLTLVQTIDSTTPHEGEVSCRAQLNNGEIAGPVSAIFYMVVDPEALFKPRQYVLEGGNLTVECCTSCDDSVLIFPPQNGEIVDAQIESELAGDYEGSCTLQFSIVFGSRVHLQEVDVFVIVPPQITSYKTTPTTVNSRSTPFSLSASFRSRTSNFTSINWERIDKVLPTQSQQETTPINEFGHGNTSLSFNQLSRADSGVYRVTVSNSHEVIPEDQRSVSAEMELIVIAPPALPSDLSAQYINLTHFRISWRLTHQTPDEAASYLHLNLIQPFNRDIPVPLATSEEFILEVEPGYDYLLTLTASNEDGIATTLPISFSIPAQAPLITSVTVQRLDPISLAVSVTLQYTGGGTITNITLLTNNGVSLVLQDVQELEHRRWGGDLIDSRLMAVEYSRDVYTVRATNERGLSATRNATQMFILPGPPTQLTDVSDSDTTFTVQFSLSMIGTEPITEVAMEMRSPDSNTTLQNANGSFVGGESVMLSVESLSPGVQYTVVVYAVNVEGRGPDSDPLTVFREPTTSVVPVEALIGIGIGGCVLLTILLILCVIFSIYCYKYMRNRSGKRYCTADCKDVPNNMKAIESLEIKNNTLNGALPRGEGTLTPRSPIMSSRASSTIPVGTEYSYQDSEVDQDSVFNHAPLHKKQLDNALHYHYQYRHSPVPPPPPLSIHKEQLFSSSTDLDADIDLMSPAPTTLSYATDV